MIMVGDIKLPHWEITWQNMSKDTEEVHNTARQQGLTEVARPLHPTGASVFIRNAIGTINKIDHIMGS